MDKIKRSELLNRMSLPRRLLHIAIAIACFVGAAVLAMPAQQTSSPADDPFAAFADVMPGNSALSFDSTGFACSEWRVYSSKHKTQTCTTSLSGEFTQLQVRITNDTIQRISLTPADTTITVDELIALWGEPEMDHYSRSTFLRWRDQGVVAVATRSTCGRTGQHSLSIWRIHFS